ncbi:MAG: beta-lactamase family protein [Gemmatimonadaceae bacterium]|nr:beta-lactamase family protein [Gemmatimonadaceae bacterium]
MDSISNAVLAATGVPSATVAVVSHGRLVYANAYGNAKLDPSVAASPSMRYALGSISKQFTASAILLLQEEGKLSLDDPVSKFIPGLTHGDKITVRQVLSHTSGYQDFWPQDYLMPPMKKSVTPQQIVDRWGKQALDFEPGSRWQYSNTNYTIAGMIVEKAAGMPYYDFIRKRILVPLGMTSALNFDVNPRAADATGYIRYALGPLHSAPDAGAGWMWAAGELAMTASDLAKWDIAMINKSLLKPASYRALQNDVHLSNGAATGYGLGVDVSMSNGHFLVEHGGEVSGFTAENRVYPNDSAAIVVLTNQDAAPASGAIAQQIAAQLFATEDATAKSEESRIRSIFEGLRRGEIDRTQFTSNANAYFDEIALKDFASSLAPLGELRSFTQISQSLRGGYVLRRYRASFAARSLRVWIFEQPDGKLEQLQVAPIA